MNDDTTKTKTIYKFKYLSLGNVIFNIAIATASVWLMLMTSARILDSVVLGWVSVAAITVGALMCATVFLYAIIKQGDEL